MSKFFPVSPRNAHVIISFKVDNEASNFYLRLFSSLQLNGQRIPSEAYFLHKAQHRHVIKIYECFTSGDFHVFVMERPTMCGDLRELLSMTILRENQARWYFKQILEASVCCEENGVAHRDLKPENILVDLETDEIKIIDFGLASEV